MSKIVDARGLSCPQPVILTLDAMKAGEDRKLEILVDTDTSMENVSRAAKSKGWRVADVTEKDGGFGISIEKDK